jgi:hypothetical protein
MAKGKKTGGRKAGTPNKATEGVKELARQYGPDAIKEAAKLAGLTDGGAFKAESEQVRLAAINTIIDRAYGKATQVLSGEDGQALMQPVINITIGNERATHVGSGTEPRPPSPPQAG